MKKIFILVFIVFISGCTTTYRTNQRFFNYFDTPKAIVMMYPDIKINKLTAGGISELVDEWSEQSKIKTLGLIKEELSPFRSINLSLINEDKLEEENKYFLKEEKGLFNAVAYSIISHTYVPQSTFKHKIDNFDYTLGPDVSKISEMFGGDSLLFISGCNYIWTAGRVGLSVFSTLVGSVTGVTLIVPAGPEWFLVALVDGKTGEVTWFDYMPMPGDLRNEDVLRRNIKRIFSSFPRKWR